VYLDQDGGLVVSGGRENLRLLGWDDSVAGDELGEDTAGGLVPMVSGQTSMRTTSSTPALLERIPPWMTALYVTASSGLIPFEGSFPKYSLMSC
jgi:hypothetical protein